MRAGTPMMVMLSGTSVSTTLLATITTLLPILHIANDLATCPKIYVVADALAAGIDQGSRGQCAIRSDFHWGNKNAVGRMDNQSRPDFGVGRDEDTEKHLIQPLPDQRRDHEQRPNDREL